MPETERLRQLEIRFQDHLDGCKTEKKTLEERVRVNENYRLAHDAKSVASWEEQHRLNKEEAKNFEALKAHLKTLYKHLGNVPKVEDMTKLEQQLTNSLQKQEQIVNILERNKGRDDVVKVVVTALITLALSGLCYVLFK